jgi:hypothetical protein
MIKSLAAMTAQFLEGGIPAAAIAVESICIQRAIVGNFGTHFDLSREPVLPSQCAINVVGDDPSPLPLDPRHPWGDSIFFDAFSCDILPLF